MKTEVVKVTPAIATAWLTLNTHNRVVAPQRVDAYAKDMLAGNWKLTHQGVAISVDNVIGDGQHRLLAVQKSGVTVEMLVTTGLPTEAIIAIDRGFVRTISNAINMSIEGSGWINSKVTAASKWAYVRRGWATSAAEVYNSAVKMKPSLLFAADNMRGNVPGITRAAVVGTIALMHAYGENEDTLSEFCRKLLSGSTEGDADTAIVRLREWLITNPASDYATGIGAQARTQRAYLFFEAQTPCKRLLAPEVLPFQRMEYPPFFAQ